MEPVIKIYLDAQGKVRMEGSIEDDGINLQLLLKCAESVGLRIADERKRSVSDLRGLLLLKPTGG